MRRRLPHAAYDRVFGWVLMLLTVYSAFVSDIRAEELIKPLPEEVEVNAERLLGESTELSP